jgi:serine/threonine protein kinase
LPKLAIGAATTARFEGMLRALARRRPEQVNQSLPEGFSLGEYRLRRLIAGGGFSFVYLATDGAGMPLAVKEYMPATLRLRAHGGPTVGAAPADLAAFRLGMKCFFEEGRALAGLHHPNVVRVLNFFRANGTAYMVMRYERGDTLQSRILGGAAQREDWIRIAFAGLLNGLREVHAAKLLHLDIKPANIYLREDSVPLLIDFGAARQAHAEDARRLPPIHTPGFASPEQHADRSRLGPWSDIYSVGACLYACLAGKPPPPAAERLQRDRLEPARRGFAGRYSATLLEIIDWCLRIDLLERPQSVFALQKALSGERSPGRLDDAPAPGPLRRAMLRRAAG